MQWVSKLPIRKKITVIIATTCSVVLLLAFLVLALYEVVDFRSAMARDSIALADILGRNTEAALTFDDPDAARKILDALRADPTVAGARVYRSSGESFAEYIRSGMAVTFPASPGDDGQRFSRHSLFMVRPITLDKQRIGTIYLVTDLQRMYDRLIVFTYLSLVVLIGGLIFAIILSSRLQRPISQPILELAEIAKVIAERRDYRVRAPPQSTNELAILTEAFNHMLAQIERHSDELASTNAELQQFAYIASHDLKEPLRMITLYMSIIERQLGPALGQQHKRYLDYAVGGAHRMQTLINDLLSFTRTSYSPERGDVVDLNLIAADVLANLGDQIDRLKAVIEVGSLPTLYGARTKLALVFQNLITNALKFIEPGETPRISITAAKVDGMWEISIADNGIGIEPQYHHKIFSVFQRLHAREEYPGNGMGLAICRKIIEQHHGEIRIRSLPGQGSTFILRLRQDSAHTDSLL